MFLVNNSPLKRNILNKNDSTFNIEQSKFRFNFAKVIKRFNCVK